MATPAHSGMTLEDADRIAARYHLGQADKSGMPYIRHPRAVAASVAAAGGSTAQQVAAVLHDVVEDTEATLEKLADLGVPDEALVLVDAMTKRDGESHEDYLDRLASVPGAILIKRCDIAHNTSPERMAKLPPRLRGRLTAKYERALRRLDALESGRSGAVD
ncbi:HD domain-containing protein [Stackebrandtia albiflava]|uniref:HD domain-containing protein n=1 Tax=Stackebrandtia albiflava TaxID=406432 RepID=A0A562VDR2_9ACTN|nr:HD domain-containing protein [Stackebrandtia albiflava]TWJ15998.1 HD domain-containing protein [Stackebrandtia albiflava]